MQINILKTASEARNLFIMTIVLWKIIKKGQILAKKEKNGFLVSCPPFLAEKREIEKKTEKREFLVLVQPIVEVETITIFYIIWW